MTVMNFKNETLFFVPRIFSKTIKPKSIKNNKPRASVFDKTGNITESESAI